MTIIVAWRQSLFLPYDGIMSLNMGFGVGGVRSYVNSIDSRNCRLMQFRTWPLKIVIRFWYFLRSSVALDPRLGS